MSPAGPRLPLGGGPWGRWARLGSPPGAVGGQGGEAAPRSLSWVLGRNPPKSVRAGAPGGSAPPAARAAGGEWVASPGERGFVRPCPNRQLEIAFLFLKSLQSVKCYFVFL